MGLHKLFWCTGMLIASILAHGSDQSYPQDVVPFSELHPISTKLTENKHYQLHIRRPITYNDSPDRYYPTLYILDPYWDFPMVTGLLETMIYDGVIPEIFVVGIGYPGKDADHNALRGIDMMPDFENVKRSGGHRFLKLIKQEIIPYVEKNYRADPEFKAIGGVSFGGMFTIFAMLEEPELFQGIISSTGFIGFNNAWVFQKEAQIYSQKDDDDAIDFNVRLYYTAADKEAIPAMLGYAYAFNEVLKHRDYKNFAYEFKLLENTTHATGKFETYVRGMQFVFKDYVIR